MAELTTTTETAASSCCTAEGQATCCEPTAKAECCAPNHGEDCECSAGRRADSPDIREQVRERYATGFTRKQARPVPCVVERSRTRRTVSGWTDG
jgi:hypothetical protein